MIVEKSNEAGNRNLVSRSGSLTSRAKIAFG